MCNQREKKNSGPPIRHTQRCIQSSLIKKWSDEADAKLQDWFASTEWNLFRDSSNLLQKLWFTGRIRTEVKARAAALKEEIPLCPPTNHQTGEASIQD